MSARSIAGLTWPMGENAPVLGTGKNHAMNTASVSTLLNTAAGQAVPGQRSYDLETLVRGACSCGAVH